MILFTYDCLLPQRTRTATIPSRSVTPGPSSGTSVQGSGQKHGPPSSQGGPPAKRARVTPFNAQDKPSRPTSHSRGVTPTPSNGRGATPSTSDDVVRAPLRVSAQTNGITPPLPALYPHMKSKISAISDIPLIVPNATTEFRYASGIGVGTAPLRLPSGMSGYPQSSRYGSGSTVRSVSASSIPGGSRYQSATVARATAKVAKRRDSFKPRPSADHPSIDLSGTNNLGWSAGDERVLKEESDEELEVY